MVPITVWHDGQNGRESRTMTTVHRDLDRVGGLTWLAYRGRRADRNPGDVGGGGTHFCVNNMDDWGRRSFLDKMKFGWGLFTFLISRK